MHLIDSRRQESNGTLVAREQGLPHGSSHEVQTVGTGGLVQWAVRVFKRPKTPTVNEALEREQQIVISEVTQLTRADAM